MSEALCYLRSDDVSAPRVAQWYAWTYLIAPVTAPLYLANRYVRIMESYLEAPELHAQMVANPAMRGGPLLDWPAERADGHAMEQLYAALPDELRGFTELVYTLTGAPELRFIEALLYRSRLYDASAQSALAPQGGGSLADPNLKLALEAAGFKDVQEMTALQTLRDEDLEITALPFLGEHADLDIRTKAAWLVDAAGVRLLFVADSNNLESRLYERLKPVVGDVHALFIGMECEGAPLSWLYAPLLLAPLERSKDQSRRLDGSDHRRAFNMVRSLGCEQVFVYALGLEPWLAFISSIEPNPDSAALRSTRALIAACDEISIPAEHLYGRAEG